MKPENLLKISRLLVKKAEGETYFSGGGDTRTYSTDNPSPEGDDPYSRMREYETRSAIERAFDSHMDDIMGAESDPSYVGTRNKESLFEDNHSSVFDQQNVNRMAVRKNEDPTPGTERFRLFEHTIGKEVRSGEGSDQGKKAINEAFKTIDHSFEEPAITKMGGEAAFDQNTRIQEAPKSKINQSISREHRNEGRGTDIEQIWKEHDSSDPDPDYTVIGHYGR